jgi:hypothetical protein
MLFNLSRQRSFTSKYGNAIEGSGFYGPFFGDYSGELIALYAPFNGNRNCGSWANESGYKIPIEGGKNMLSN